MVKISFAVEHELFGLSAGVSHFFNIIIYLIGLLLLYEMLLILFSGYDKAITFYSVVLFTILPIHSEVIASLKNRDILLCFVFCLISVKNILLYFEGNQKKWWLLLFSLLYFYFAFLSKFDVLPYIAIIPVLVFIKYRPPLKWIIAILLLMFISYLLYRVSRRGILDKTTAKLVYYYFENPLYFEQDLKYKIIAMFNSLGFYINQIIMPLRQCCYYGFDTISVHKLGTYGYLGILASPLLVFGLIKSYVKKDFMLFSGLFIFCASISVYLNV